MIVGGDATHVSVTADADGGVIGSYQALALGTTLRTLQRRLADRNTSLREITTAMRLELSGARLRDGRASTADIARSLGYSDGTALGRVLKRWTGKSPTDLRGKA